MGRLPISIIKIGGEIPNSGYYKASADKGTILLGIYRKKGDEKLGLTTFNLPEEAIRIKCIPDMKFIEFTYKRNRYRIFEIKDN